jgi:hypothetical protein
MIIIFLFSLPFLKKSSLMLNAKFVEINSYTNEITTKVAEATKDQTKHNKRTNKKNRQTKESKKSLIN